MKSYTDRHWAVEEKREMHDVSLLTRVHLSLFLYGESQWRNRPKVYEYRGSMPICISSSTQGESQWGHRPSGLWVHGSMPICIVEGNKEKASEVIDRQVYEYTARCRWSVYEKKRKICGIIKKTLAFKILV